MRPTRDHAVRPPIGSRQAPQRSAHRRPRPRGRTRDVEGHGLHRRGSGEAHHRRRHDLDRDDAVQPQSARPRGARQAWRARRGRNPDGVQHDRGLGRRLDGDLRHARLARLARGDRGLDRAGRARPPLRRARPARGVRQDEPRRCDGGRAGSTFPPSSRTPARSPRASTASARCRSATCTRGSAPTPPAR